MPVDYSGLRNEEFSQSPYPVSNIPNILAARLGSGLALPFSLQQQLWKTRNGLDKLRQDIFVTLYTPVGSRFWQCDFGSLLPMLIFEPYNSNFFPSLEQATEAALNAWVKTILVQAVTASMQSLAPNIVNVTINYLIKGTILSAETASLNLSTNDEIQFSPSDFLINGVPFFS